MAGLWGSWADLKEWTGYGAALLMVGLVSLSIGLIIGLVSIANISMLYLIAILASATIYGRGPAILAAFASFLVFNWFFIDPHHTLTVADPEQWVALVLFLLTGIVTSQLAAGQRDRARQAELREREALVLYDVVRLLSEANLEQALAAVSERLRHELGLTAVSIDLANDGTLMRRALAGDGGAIPPASALAEHPLELPTAGSSPTLHSQVAPGKWLGVIPPGPNVKARGLNQHLHIVSITSDAGTAGIMSLVHPASARELTAAEDRLLSAVATQIALAVERRRLRQEATDTEILRRSDELKTALLNAVSHDLKTPLVSIMASSGALLQREVVWSDQERHDFVEAIDQEVRRLNRLVGNLLDLSRIESGYVRPDKGWYDLGFLVDEVLGRLRWLTAGHQVEVDIPDNLPPIPLGYTEIDQVLSNLIENAVKYSTPGTEIDITAEKQGGEVKVVVADRGPGIPDSAMTQLFEPFFRVPHGTSGPRGTGVGLAVAKGLVRAHGGRIWAENRRAGGAAFVFTLPVDDRSRTAEGQIVGKP